MLVNGCFPPVRGLNNARPIDYARTDYGAREVRNLIGRLEHGVFLLIESWRIDRKLYRATAFTGEGARLYGGRWNSQGVSVVYTAEHRSLAMLEILVHLRKPKDYELYSVKFDESLVQELARPKPSSKLGRRTPPPVIRRK